MVHHNIINRVRLLAAAGLLLLASIIPFLFSQDSYALPITARSLTLELDTANSGTDEGSVAGGTVAHHFQFTMPAGSAWQSVRFLYCTTADLNDDNCTATDADLSSASLEADAGSITASGLGGAAADSFYLNFPSTTAAGTIDVTIGNAVNPSTANETFFVRLLAYDGTNASGSIVHSGTVAASTTEAIILSGYMPESLIFCAGATIEESSPGVPDCSTASAGAIKFNDNFSPTATRYSFSQMAASTNAGSGYAISVNGPTLTSGSYTIPAMAATAQPLVGVGQFGLNLVENDENVVGGIDLSENALPAGYDNDDDAGTTPTVVSNTVGTIFDGVSANTTTAASNGTNLKGQATTNYATNGSFRFVSGEAVANSQYDGAANNTPGPSDGQIYTVSYIANVAGSQAPGTYVTTLLYICTPTF